MRPFIYTRVDDATGLMSENKTRLNGEGGAHDTQLLAGGTTLLDLMKLDVMRPARVVDINGLTTSLGTIEAGPDGLRLGSLVRMAEAADNLEIKRDYPVISQSLALAASPQIRNMASLGGNVLQRTRCQYFRDTSWSHCNKRVPGSGCAALNGVNRKHAVLGVNDRCISSYPGDFAQALVALGASLHLAGRKRSRIVPFEKFHLGPDQPHIETIIEPDELITAFVIPAGPWTRRSLYLKVRDRDSYEFGLASAAVALEKRGDTVGEIRIGLGGVAYRPWRAHAAEHELRGRKLDEESATKAANIAFAAAITHGQNDYKVELGRRVLVRALLQADAMEI